MSSPLPTSSKRLVLGCGALAYDLVALIQDNPVLNELIELHCLPAKLHHRPQLIAGEVDKFLAEHAHKYADVFVAYGDCGTIGELDKVLDKYSAQRIAGEHCFEFFIGADEYQEIVDEEVGSFFLTDFLVKLFDQFVIKGLGLDRYPELFDSYFEHYTQMVYLAQTKDPELEAKAREHAEAFGLKYQYRYVGGSALNPLVENLPGIKNIRVEINHV